MARMWPQAPRDRECCAPGSHGPTPCPTYRAPENEVFDPGLFLAASTAARRSRNTAEPKKSSARAISPTPCFSSRMERSDHGPVRTGQGSRGRIFGEGQFFGEGCLLGSELRTSTSRAMEECLITSITKPAMLAALDAQPRFSAFFINYLLSRNSRIEDDLIDQLFNSSERRLARLLLLLANFGRKAASSRSR